MTYRVDIPPYVEGQFLDLALYISRHSIPRALAWCDGIHEQIHELKDWPNAHAVDADAPPI